MMTHYGAGDPCLHDPCVVAHLIDPSLFDGVEAHLAVECGAPLTLGRTVAALEGRHRGAPPPTCRVVTTVQQDRLFQLVTERVR